MDTANYITAHLEALQQSGHGSSLQTVRQQAFDVFREKGIPTTRNEEWKYTRISSLFNKTFSFPGKTIDITTEEIRAIELPGHENANQLFFINGLYSTQYSTIYSSELTVLPLEEAAAGEYKKIVEQHLGHSSNYLKDGIHALNTASLQDGVFIHVKKGKTVSHPIYIYNIIDARAAHVLSQPRSLIYVSELASVQMVETYATFGNSESFTNQVMEVVVEKDAILEYCKIQNDTITSSQVSTTHIRQIGKSYTHTVTLSLNGGIIRNNLNLVLEAPHSEAHLYGLYFLKGQSHIDNHTIVDNVEPHCESNELYKGVINDNATGVFNGKIFVRQKAQKTNAFQSNKNILLSDNASVNTKPQLEIFADDVKCSHGCTVGQLDEEGLFYLRSRGIEEKIARAMLTQAFAVDILEHIKIPAIRTYVDRLITEHVTL